MTDKNKAERDLSRRRCEVCSRVIRKDNLRYCSYACQGQALKRMHEQQRLELYLADKLNPIHTVDTGRVPRWVKRWWITAYGEQCAICGWAERHPQTRKVPLQWDH